MLSYTSYLLGFQINPKVKNIQHNILLPVYKMSKSKMKVGSRAQVMHGTAECTTGRLTKKDLMYNKQGRIVSRAKSAAGKELYKKYKDILKENQFTKK